jgi:hypothetical protein
MVERFMLLEELYSFFVVKLVQEDVKRSDVLDPTVGAQELEYLRVRRLVSMGESYLEPAASDLFTEFIGEIMIFI